MLFPQIAVHHWLEDTECRGGMRDGNLWQERIILSNIAALHDTMSYFILLQSDTIWLLTESDRFWIIQLKGAVQKWRRTNGHSQKCRKVARSGRISAASTTEQIYCTNFANWTTFVSCESLLLKCIKSCYYRNTDSNVDNYQSRSTMF